MTRTALINGCAVDIPVLQRHIDRVLDDNCHNPHAVTSFAAGLADFEAALREEHEAKRPNLLFCYLQRMYAAEAAAALLAPATERPVAA